MQFLKSLLDGFFLSRPIVWISVWGFCAFGYFRALTRDTFDLQATWSIDRSLSFGWMFVFSASVGAVFVLNQIADREVDNNNDGVPLMALGDFPFSLPYWSAAILAGCSIILPHWYGHAFIAASAIVALAIGTLYSFKPTYFSGRPCADFLSNAFGYGLVAFGVGFHLAGGDVCTWDFALASLPYVLLMSGASISSTLPDMPGDRAGGKRTTAVVLGEKTAHALATVLLLCAIGAALCVSDWIPVVCGTLALPVYLLHAFRPSQKHREACYKIGGALTVFVACVVYPALIVPSITTVVLTLLYFRIRYGVHYPSLLPISRDQNR